MVRENIKQDAMLICLPPLQQRQKHCCTTLESTSAGKILGHLDRLWNSVLSDQAQSENSPGAGAGSRVENKGCDPDSGDSGSDP